MWRLTCFADKPPLISDSWTRRQCDPTSFFVQERWRKIDHCCRINVSDLARDETFHQFRKCNQCYGDLHNKYLKLITFPYMNQNQEKGMVKIGQRKYYMMAVKAKHSPRETLEKVICNQEMKSSLCLQNNYMSPIGKCRAQTEVTQLCAQLPGCEEPSEHEKTSTARYWNAKEFARNSKGSPSASVSLCIPLSWRKSWGLRWGSYHQVIQQISRDFSFLSRTQGPLISTQRDS